MSAPSNPFGTSPAHIDPAIVRSIRQASLSSSADFGLLMAQAEQESSFQPDAKATTSSATGLYQFTDSTWLDMVRQFGAKYGIGALAQQVTAEDSGRSTVADKAVRKQILELRKDPQLSAALAGEYMQLNKSELERGLGHTVSRAALYMAHFLGTGGATTFLKAVESKGSTVAADLLPDAAAANRGIFFDHQTGEAKTVAQIYHSLGARIEHEATQLAGVTGGTADSGVAASGPTNPSNPSNPTNPTNPMNPMNPTTSTLAAAIASLPITTEPATDGTGATTATAFGARSVPRLSGGRLSQPFVAMLDALNQAALKLMSRPQHAATAGTAKATTGESRPTVLQASLRSRRRVV